MNPLIDALKKIDEITLLELLEITSEDLVDMFLDRIVERENWLYGQIREQEEDL